MNSARNQSEFIAPGIAAGHIRIKPYINVMNSIATQWCHFTPLVVTDNTELTGARPFGASG